MKIMRKLIAKVLIVCMVLLNIPLPLFAATVQEEALLQIEHSPIEKVKVGKTIPVTANFTVPEGIEIVRVYFRAVGSSPYFFVPMIASQKSEYYSILPAPNGSVAEIEYLFLVKTYDNRVFTSKVNRVAVKGEKNDSADSEQDIVDVSVETVDVPAKIVGFSDSTRIRPVDRSEKHGVIAGLYTNKDTGGTSSSGRYQGTIELSEKSYRTALLIGGGVTVGAIALVAAAGSGSSSSSDDSSGSTGSTGAGQWSLEFEYSPCSKTTSQTVNCSAEGLVTSVSPTAIGIPLPESCSNSPYGGLAELFVVGGSCDTVTACNNFSSSDLTGKTCGDTSIILYKNDGLRVERWSAQ